MRLAIALIPFLLIASYGSLVFYTIRDLSSYTYDLKPDTAEFFPFDSIDTIELNRMAAVFEERLEKYHIPANLTVMTEFDLDGNPRRYDATDNGALWTGKTLAAESFRYAVAENGTTEKEDARRMVHKILTGMIHLIAVPNGGLGPDYPGTIARYYKHFNGTGIYQDWRVRLYTSKDELGGYFLGIAAAQRLVTDDLWVQDRIKLIVAQIAEGFLDTFWQEMHGDGTPSGSILQPVFGSGGEWKLLVMKLAVNGYPENFRYRQLYHYFATKQLYLLNSPVFDTTGCISAYYGYGFAHDVVLGYLLAEDNPKYQTRFIQNYEKAYAIFAGHRNAYFNAIFLGMSTLRTDSTRYNTTQIKWDVLDQLWRFSAFNLCPYDDTYGGRNRSYSRTDFDPQGINWTIINPKAEKWREFFYNDSIGTHFQWLEELVMYGMLNPRYLKPATIEMARVSDFYWGDDPLDHAGGHGRNNPNMIYESPGTVYTLPYWMMRYYGYTK
jgi:hypothetical protein